MKIQHRIDFDKISADRNTWDHMRINIIMVKIFSNTNQNLFFLLYLDKKSIHDFRQLIGKWYVKLKWISGWAIITHDPTRKFYWSFAFIDSGITN